jgi:hypothetical protein
MLVLVPLSYPPYTQSCPPSARAFTRSSKADAQPLTLSLLSFLACQPHPVHLGSPLPNLVSRAQGHGSTAWQALQLRAPRFLPGSKRTTWDQGLQAGGLSMVRQRHQGAGPDVRLYGRRRQAGQRYGGGRRVDAEASRGSMSSGFARLGDASFGLLFIDILTLLSFHMLGLTHIVLDLSGSSGLDLTTMLSLQYIVTEAKK